jgi:hypothetical protein
MNVARVDALQFPVLEFDQDARQVGDSSPRFGAVCLCGAGLWPRDRRA